MLKLARTGNFGSLRCGMTREKLQELLGAPPIWGTQQIEDRADIWRYGNIEYHFDNLAVSFIFSNHENLTNGGSTLKIDPWIVRRNLPRSEFEFMLAKQSIQFTVARPQHDDSQCHVTTDSGIVFSFVDEPDEDWDESGLVWWTTRN